MGGWEMSGVGERQEPREDFGGYQLGYTHLGRQRFGIIMSSGFVGFLLVVLLAGDMGGRVGHS